MLKAVIRWILVLGALLAVGPVAATLLGSLHDVDGGRAVTILINGNVGSGVIGGLVVFAAAAAIGLVGSHFFSLNTGMLSAGLVLVWGCWREGSLEDLVRRAGSGKDLTTLSVEGAGVTILAAVLTWLMIKVAHRAQQPQGQAAPAGGTFLTGSQDRNPAVTVIGAIAAGAAAAGLVVWFVAVSGARGQTIAAATLGAMLAGVVAQLVVGSKDLHVTPLTPILSVALVALAGPLVASQLAGAKLVDMVYAGNVLALARPVSLDWAAGAMLGVPIGLGWAGSMLDRRHLQ